MVDKITDAIKSLEFEFTHDDTVPVGNTNAAASSEGKMQLAIMDQQDAPAQACLAKTYLKNSLSLISTVLLS